MIQKFKKYRKYREYLNNSFECKAGILAVIIIEVAFYYFAVYTDFNKYTDMLNSFFIAIIGALIGVLALILSGIAFFGALFDNDYVNDLINYTEDTDVIDKLFCSFQFLAVNIIYIVMETMVALISINSSRMMTSSKIFYIITGIYVYWLIFTISYAVALIKNCIELILLKYNDLKIKHKKTFFDKANEIRIDLLIATLMNNDKEVLSNKDKEKKLLTKIDEMVSMSANSEADKEQLRKYFEEYYKSED